MHRRHDADVVSDQFARRTGFSRLGSFGRFAAKEPDEFKASWRAMWVDGIGIGEWATTPMSGSCMPASGSCGVVLIAVRSGSVRLQVAQSGLALGAGPALVLAAGEQVRFSAAASVRLLRLVVPAELLPASARSLAKNSIGTVPTSRLIDCLTAMAEVVMDPVSGGPQSPASRAIRALALAMTEEVAPSESWIDQRGQIVTFIERHLTDPALTPTSIAEALGISLRWLHQRFNKDGDTVAQYIRMRRLDLVASHLDADHRFPRVSALAERSGFPSRDQLTRAFKARYGITIAEYAAAAASGRAIGNER